MATGRYTFEAIDLGLMKVADFERCQDDIRARRAARAVPDCLLVVRHPPTVTYTSIQPPYLLFDGADLERAGISRARTIRGGGTLYLDPGHLCLCPVADISVFGGAVDYQVALDRITVGTLRRLGVPAVHRDGWSGAWLSPDRRIASIGAAVRRAISSYGVFINVDGHLEHCSVVPKCSPDCGKPVSLRAEFGPTAPTFKQLIDEFRSVWCKELSRA
jgi:lipoyl synthase